MGDSVPKHNGGDLIDGYSPRTERLENPTDHHQKETSEMERPHSARHSSCLPIQLLGIELHSRGAQRLRFADRGTSVAPAARSRTMQSVKAALQRMSGQRWLQPQSEGSLRQSLGCQTYQRQQSPYCCQRRNHGLCASISSCLRFAAARSFGLSGLVSGAAKMRSRHSMSAIVCSASILSQYPTSQPSKAFGSVNFASSLGVRDANLFFTEPHTITRLKRSAARSSRASASWWLEFGIASYRVGEVFNIDQISRGMLTSIGEQQKGVPTMSPEPKDKRWFSIAEQASKEMDAAKLSLLVEQLCSALDQRLKEPVSEWGS